MMRALPALLITLLLATGATSIAWAAQPFDRWERMNESERYEDVAEQIRKWFEKNADHELAPDATRLLAEAEYHVMMAGTPTVDALAAYRAEFPDGPREPEAFEAHATLSFYTASSDGTEAGFRAVAEEFPGTKAAGEALLRAEEAGFNESVSEGSAAAMSRYLGLYPESPNAATATRLWRTRAWDEAETLNTLQGWIQLRMEDPEHPRADEAWMLEQALALQELPPKASTEALLKLARRYEGTPTGWETLRRVVSRSSVRFSTAEGVGLLDAVLTDGDSIEMIEAGLMQAVTVEAPGRLPETATFEFGLEVEVEGRNWEWWDARAASHAGTWGGEITPLPERVGPALHWLTGATPCRLPHLTDARVRVRLKQEKKKEDWILPVSLDTPCGGVVPLAVRYGPGGVVDATAQVVDAGIDPVIEPVAVRAGGLAWSCAGALHVEDTGLWLTCSGWEVSRWGQGLLFRPPPLGVASATGNPEHGALAALPVDDTHRWLALDVPTSWHFGGGPACPLPDDPPDPAPLAEGAEPPPAVEPTGPAPEMPLWVHPSLTATVDRTEDVDGDGKLDRVAFLAPRGEHPAWIVVTLASFGPDLSWTAPWRGEILPEGSTLSREGCGYRVEGPEG
ncbi:MAG: hypothetical protein GY898_02450 [Proteobacteria bacterium]|nr:hypothetical protein [Pseudomonadota bacterium]